MLQEIPNSILHQIYNRGSEEWRLNETLTLSQHFDHSNTTRRTTTTKWNKASSCYYTVWMGGGQIKGGEEVIFSLISAILKMFLKWRRGIILEKEVYILSKEMLEVFAKIGNQFEELKKSDGDGVWLEIVDVSIAILYLVRKLVFQPELNTKLEIKCIEKFIAKYGDSINPVVLKYLMITLCLVPKYLNTLQYVKKIFNLPFLESIDLLILAVVLFDYGKMNNQIDCIKDAFLLSLYSNVTLPVESENVKIKIGIYLISKLGNDSFSLFVKKSLQISNKICQVDSYNFFYQRIVELTEEISNIINVNDILIYLVTCLHNLNLSIDKCSSKMTIPFNYNIYKELNLTFWRLVQEPNLLNLEIEPEFILKIYKPILLNKTQENLMLIALFNSHNTL